jgi:hypothetical protein
MVRTLIYLLRISVDYPFLQKNITSGQAIAKGSQLLQLNFALPAVHEKTLNRATNPCGILNE